jgi:hypothetical protein
MRPIGLTHSLERVRQKAFDVQLVATQAPARRARALICTVVLAAILGTVWPASRLADAASLDGQHDPTVTIGASKIRNLLLFVWDHRCAACGSVYRETVIKLDPEIASGALTVMLVQTLPSQDADDQLELINAAALLLAPSPAYTGIVIGWLEDEVAAKSPTRDAVSAEVAKTLRENWSRDPQTLSAALSDNTRLARALTVLKVWSDEVNRKWPRQGAPLLILNGRPIAQWGITDPTAINIRRLLLRR